MKGWLTAGLLALAASAAAQSRGDVGAGLVIGSPTSVTGKFWFDSTAAVDLAFSDRMGMHADLLLQNWSFFPQPASGKLGLYAGGGAGSDGGGAWGLRGAVGANYWAAQHPLELFMELAPLAVMEPSASVHWEAGLGARWYFERF